MFTAQPVAPAFRRAGASGWAVKGEVRLELQAGFQPLLQTFFTTETSLLSDDLAIFEDHDLRNPVSGSVVSKQLGTFIDIDLQKLRAGRESRLQVVNGCVHSTTGTTPVGSELHNHGMIVFQNRLSKPGIIDRLWLTSATASKNKQGCQNDANANSDVSVERIHGAGLQL